MGKKSKYILTILIFATVLLSAVGFSTWIITNQINTAFPQKYNSIILTPTLNPISTDFDQLQDKTKTGLLNAAQKDAETSNKVYFEDADKFPRTLTLYDEDTKKGDYKITINSITDGNSWTGNNAIGSTYLATATLELKNYKYAFLQDGKEVYTTTVYALFRYKTCKLGAGGWYTIEDAIATAKTATNKSIVIYTDGTNLSQTTFCNLNSIDNKIATDLFTVNYKKEKNKSYVLDSGVTLTLPHTANSTTIHEINDGKTGSINSPNTYKKNELLLPDDLSLTCNNTLLVGGVTTGQQGGRSGCTSGNFAQITLGKNAKLTKSGSGNVECWGFIGENTTNNGSGFTMETGSLKMPFIVVEHRGGTIFSKMARLECSPFNRFWLENVYCTLTIKNNASLVGHANLYAGSQDNETDIALIGRASGNLLQFANTSSYLVAKHNKSTQVTDLDTFGDIKVNSLTLTINLFIVPVTLSTKDVLFPVSYLYDVSLNPIENANATVSLGSQSIKLLPGAKLTVNKGVTLDASDASIAVYQQFADNIVGAQTAYPTDKGAAELILNGDMTVKNLGGTITTKQTDNTAPATLQVTNSLYVNSKEILNEDGDCTNGTEYGTANADNSPNLYSNLIYYVNNGTVNGKESTTLTTIPYQSVYIDDKYYWAKSTVSATGKTDADADFSRNVETGTLIYADMFVNYGYEVNTASYNGTTLFDGTNATNPTVYIYDDFNVTVTFDSTATKYTVIYDHNNDTGSVTTVETVDTALSTTLGKDASGKIITPQKEGYKLIGWAATAADAELADEDRTKLLDSSEFTTDLAGGTNTITVYAAWEQVYTVNFDKNYVITAGENTVVFSEYADLAEGGTTYSIPSVEVSRDGYKFIGWSNDSILTENSTIYAENSDVTNAIANGKVITLYAVWEELYHVVYDLGGTVNVTITALGETIIKNGITTYTHHVDLNGASSLTYDSYTLIELDHTNTTYVDYDWYEKESDETYTLLSKENPFIITSGNNKYYYIYALWTQAYSIVFNGNEGTSNITSENCLSQLAITEAMTAEREGHTFLGWATTKEATQPEYTYDGNNIVTNLASLDALNGTTDHIVTLYAVWKPWATVTILDNNNHLDTINIANEEVDSNVAVSIDPSSSSIVINLTGETSGMWFWKTTYGITAVTIGDTTLAATNEQKTISYTVNGETLSLTYKLTALNNQNVTLTIYNITENLSFNISTGEI